jgi:FtsZ-interacting cell division protein ZipA
MLGGSCCETDDSKNVDALRHQRRMERADQAPKMNNACNETRDAVVTQSDDDSTAQSKIRLIEAASAAGARKKHPSTNPIKPAANISQPTGDVPNYYLFEKSEGLVLKDKRISLITVPLMLTRRVITTFETF